MRIEKTVNKLGMTLTRFSQYSGVSFYILKRIDAGFKRTRPSTLSRVSRAVGELKLAGPIETSLIVRKLKKARAPYRRRTR